MYVYLLILSASRYSYVCLRPIDHIVPSPEVALQQTHHLSVLIASKWKQVAFNLKPQPMEYSEVEEIATKCPDSMQEQAMEMLQRWKARDGRTVTVDVVFDVLVNASCKAKAEEVFGLNTVQMVHSQMPDSDRQS